jgi:DMSO/TMAO reductase YedYZ molybdopterin-dependent catalytic subunit
MAHQKFPVLHYPARSRFDPTTWDFRVWGEVEQQRRWTWDESQKLPDENQDGYPLCDSLEQVRHRLGSVSLRTLVDGGLVRLKPNARHVLQHCEYGFTVNIPLQVGLSQNFLLATHFDGQPLTPDHGYPLRGVVGFIPGREELKTPYLWKGGKWLRGLEFLENDRLGFWEQAGYHNEADIWLEQRFAGD